MRKNYSALIAVTSVFVFSLFAANSCKKDSKEQPPVVVEKVKGCTDSNSLTYNPAAEVDDGSCLQVEVKHRALFLDFTATWCSSCGGEGIPMFEAAIAAHPNDVVPLSCHNSDEMSNPLSETFLTYYYITGLPTLVVGNQGEVWGSTVISNAINAAIAPAPVANSVGIITYSGTAITVKTQSKFFTATTGEYYLATYFVENGLVYYQNNAATNPWTHKHVLRGSATGNQFGELIASGNIASGKSVNKNYSVTAGTGWNLNNIYIALVIWKKSGNTYSVVNAWQSKAN